MNLFLIAPYYLRWHYTKAYIDLARIWRNYMWFFWNLFSIPLLLQTLLSPWKRLGEKKSEHFSFENFFYRLVINSVMRCVGFVVRIIFILAGLSLFILVVIGGICAYIVWTCLPFIVAGLLVYAFSIFIV